MMKKTILFSLFCAGLALSMGAEALARQLYQCPGGRPGRSVLQSHPCVQKKAAVSLNKPVKKTGPQYPAAMPDGVRPVDMVETDATIGADRRVRVRFVYSDTRTNQPVTWENGQANARCFAYRDIGGDDSSSHKPRRGPLLSKSFARLTDSETDLLLSLPARAFDRAPAALLVACSVKMREQIFKSTSLLDIGPIADSEKTRSGTRLHTIAYIPEKSTDGRRRLMVTRFPAR